MLKIRILNVDCSVQCFDDIMFFCSQSVTSRSFAILRTVTCNLMSMIRSSMATSPKANTGTTLRARQFANVSDVYEDDCLANFTATVDKMFRRAYVRLGRALANQPWSFIGISLLLTCLSCGGYLGLTRQQSRSQLFTSRNSPAWNDNAFALQYFPPSRALSFLVCCMIHLLQLDTRLSLR